MAAPKQVIRGRITPPSLPSRLLSRPRLEHTVARLIDDHPLVCIYATAGSGKTTVVLQAARATGRPLAWFSTDRTDAATGRLLTYLEASIAEQVPEVAGVAATALAARAPHREVAGLLAEAIGDVPLLLVLDDLEQLARAEGAVAVLSAFLRYLPPTARVVLVGRAELSVELGPPAAAQRRVAAIGEGDLAFTLEEVSEALAAAGCLDIDPGSVLQLTGGWVAGVLFEAWRSEEHVPGVGGEADPLHGYLSSQILSELKPAECEFLIVTSVLDQVTASAAEALGFTDARTLLHSLGQRHLPASWDREGRTMRCHPRFREYLLERLARSPAQDVRAVRRRHGAFLAKEGHHEEAVGEFLEVGALEDALDAAEQCLESVIGRADFDVAERWLTSMAPVRRHRRRLAAEEMMLALGKEGYGRTVALADELAETGERDALARSSSRAGTAMSWCYVHTGRLDDARAVHEVTAPGSPHDAMHYLLSCMDDEPPSGPVAHMLSGDMFDAIVTRVHYYRGHFPLIMGPSLSGWAGRLAGSWRIGSLVSMGHTAEALELFESVRNEPGGGGLWLTGVLGVKLMAQLGREDEAWQSLFDGRRLIRASGSAMLEMFSYLEEAELNLKLNRDPETARAALAKVLKHHVGRTYSFVTEQAETLLGWALLLQDENAEAARCLTGVVRSSRKADRVYCLADAAVYLAEARWRLGEEELADESADIALEAARRQGSNHLLLQALSEFPAVLTRRLDAEPRGDGPWHGLARALSTPLSHAVVGHPSRHGAGLELREFGRLAISVDGEEVRPRIRKSYELLAYLAGLPTPEATKEELLGALFDGRADGSAGAYLRQAVLKLRQALPEGKWLEASAGRVRVTADVVITTEARRFEATLAEAAELRGQDRLTMLERALEIVDGGEYLPGVTSAWADHRRAYLARCALDARLDAAEAAYSCANYREAQRLAEETLARDPFREAAWRLVMRVAHAIGDEHQVIVAYRNCEQAMREIGESPSAVTRDLIVALRA
jgi:DNA-binding SARP family transcriptional activator/tetratricopeptide (TPR) repeat protein